MFNTRRCQKERKRDTSTAKIMAKGKEIRCVITIVVIVVAVLLISWFGIRFAFGVSNPFYVVASESMVPTLNVGDLLIIKKHSDSEEDNPNSSFSFSNLKVGDIIIFKAPYYKVEGKDRIIVHRVAQIAVDSEGERIIRTKGDANPGSIPGLDYPIREKDYIGKVTYDIPKVGLITQVLSPPVNYVLIGVIAIALVYTLRKQIQQSNVRK
jgi:signal peptidase I